MNRLRPCVMALLLPVCVPSIVVTTAGGESPPYQPPMERFVTNRPRLFLSASSLPAVMEYATRTQPDLLTRIREHLRSLSPVTTLPPGDYGTESAAAAFLFLCERTPARLDQAAGLLERSITYYRDCDRKNQVVNHYSATRIHTIMAYDWLYDAMPPEARERLGRALMDHVERRLPGPHAVSGDNQSDYRSGFYGESSLLWYAGIATRGTGLDETKSAAAIAFGYDQQMRLLEHRRRAAGDDGGAATTTLGYALRADPWAEFNFFHTMKSAFGMDIAADWPYVALLPNYVLWNRLPAHVEFGVGDSFHVTNEFPDEHLFTHLAQIRHFYGQSRPEQAALAAWLQEQCPRSSYNLAWPLTPFLLTELDRSPPSRAPPSTLPLARHFEGMGQIFMRSGWGAEDTYALFTAGGLYDRHKHFDENSFTIFHKGFLAMDTGTRPTPGSHLFQYYCRTVAHNAVLIHMDGECMRRYWGEPAPGEYLSPVNDGGMGSPTGAVVRAFRTTPDFTYIASDATACYDPAKCRLALRQFVYVPPNVFVVFDRVQTVKREQRVTWLLHTAEKPSIEGDRFHADYRGGRIWCRTLLPSKAVLTAVGGPGKEFWSDGRNWALPANPVLGGESIKQPELLGGWRMEVSPQNPATDNVFLNLIETGDTLTGTNMVSARRLWDWNWTRVEFLSGERHVTVRFRKSGDIGCEIGITGAGQDLVETLGNTVQPQSEWAQNSSGSSGHRGHRHRGRCR